jgi:hypothetical protein
LIQEITQRSSPGVRPREDIMCSTTRLVGVVAVIAAGFLLFGPVSWAQQPKRSQTKPRAVPTPAAQVPLPNGVLLLHLALPQVVQPAPHITARALAIPTPPPGGFGIVSSGSGGGGRFSDSASDAAAWLGSGGYGIQAFGNYGGGYFQSANASGAAWVGNGDYGIQASGNTAGGMFGGNASGVAYIAFTDYGIVALGNDAGGYFKSSNASGYALVGYGDLGIYGTGNGTGGYFQSANASGYAKVGYGDWGIQAFGTVGGGYFKDSDGSGYAYVGYGEYGIRAFGNIAGGYFKSANASGYANVGYGDYGVEAAGNIAGGHFTSANASGYADVGYGNYGVYAAGNTTGGYFKSANASGYANVGYGDYGVYAAGNAAGGYFKDADQSGYAYVGYYDNGIAGWGQNSGGEFSSLSTSSWADAGDGSYKIVGNGSVNFVQNHPTDPGAVIVYAAPEGDEVATYTRGTARLAKGEARVPLGETFRWVTNPDLGLTAYVTPVGAWCDLYVAEKGTSELVVHSRDGSDCNFDYIVYGLRIGFEETAVVQEKRRESYIPSMKDHRELLARRPDLAKFTALARYGAGREAMGVTEPLKLERANALKAAIHEFDPAVDKVEQPVPPNPQPASTPSGQGAAQAGTAVAPLGPAQRHVEVEPVVTGGAGEPVAVSDEQDIQARSFSSPREQLAARMAVAGAVEAGDVLVVDRERPGMFVRGDRTADPTVVGVVVADAGVTLGPPPGEGSSAPVALSGIARCKVDASFGAILPGDLLVSSPTRGHAMREASPLPGTVVGKALEPLASGQGIIRILVMLR